MGVVIMAVFYGVFNAEGSATAYYNSDIFPPQSNGDRNEKIPPEAVEITEEQWLTLVQDQPMARYLDGEISYVELPSLPPMLGTQ